MKPLFKPSGSKIIDDFIRHTQINYVRKEGKLEFIPYDQFKNLEFIAEGGFSKIYKGIWKDGPISKWDNKSNTRQCDYTVALKKLNDSKDITHKGLNELKIFYDFSLKWKASRMYSSYKYISNYFGITRDPVTEDIMIVMPYYNSGDLIYYITKVFYEIKWEEKLKNLIKIIIGLMNIHSQEPTKIIESSDIGPVSINAPGAIYKSRPLSAIINSAMSLKISRKISRSRSIKISKSRLIDTDYISRELEFDI
ncbi:uncharacterized protein OCT59_001134 [Rhizophagus irregularis]|uniref:uncharacterized protein n=1 Tax=Rhizophagus irregularis TaxID=588596 RepID=UPI00331ADCF5|nr:hypothetical protein OCT59_001134 [Rhizophagus irregularis]